jgi:hypothetical protein
MLREKMPWIGHNPSMRIADHRFFCVRAAVLAILCTLAVTATAYGDEPGSAPSPPAPSETTGLEGQSGGSGSQSEEPQGAGGGQTQETTGEGASEKETSQGSGGVVGEEPSEPATTKEVTKEGTENSPAITGTGETTGTTSVEVPPVAEQTPPEATKEAAVSKGSQEGQEGVPALHSVSGETGTSQAQSAVSHAQSTSEAGAESQTAIVAGPLSPPPTAPTAGDGEAQVPATLAIGGGGGGPRGGMTVAQRAGTLSCELAALGGRSSDNCSVGWLGEKRVADSSTVSFSPVDNSLAPTITGTVPPGGGHGGSAVGNAPVSPAPGPAPGGASGAAVGGSSGVAPSAFLSLAGLLLLAAPRAMRRLRLSSRPWLTACFVLIPERPG